VSRKRSIKSWTVTEAEGLTAEDVFSGVRGITAEDLDVVFQPIVDLRHRRVHAVESLTRCKLPDYPTPTALFTAASEQQATGRLGRLVREVTFERCGARMPVFVNIHPDELTSRWLVRPDDPINLHDGPLFLEITESAALDYYDLCRGVLREICARTGATLVVDDLGAGYSNLKRIVDLQPGVVKLDLALIRGLDVSRRQQILVKNVVQLCRDLGASVVAEGIETVAELEAVVDLGCDFGQGYLLARPGYPIPKAIWPAGA